MRVVCRDEFAGIRLGGAFPAKAILRYHWEKMSADPNKKSARTFQCRDVLWETFEQMARELECSIDYLINESMKQYARQRSYSPRTPFPGPVRPDGAPAMPGQPGAP